MHCSFLKRLASVLFLVFHASTLSLASPAPAAIPLELEPAELESRRVRVGHHLRHENFTAMAHVTDSYPACGMPWSSLNLKFVAAYADLWLFGHERGRCGQCIALCGEKDCNPVLLVDQHDGTWEHRRHDWWVSEEMYSWLSGMHGTKRERLQLHRPINSYECRGIWDGTMIGDAEPPGLLKNLHPDNLVKTYFHADLGDTRESMVMHTMEEDGDHLQVGNDEESKSTKVAGNSTSTASGSDAPQNRNNSATTVTEIKTTTTIVAIVIKTKTSTTTTAETTTWRHEALDNPGRKKPYQGNPPDTGPRIGDYRTLTLRDVPPAASTLVEMIQPSTTPANAEVSILGPLEAEAVSLKLRKASVECYDPRKFMQFYDEAAYTHYDPKEFVQFYDDPCTTIVPLDVQLSSTGELVIYEAKEDGFYQAPRVTAALKRNVENEGPTPTSTHLNAWRYFLKGFFGNKHTSTLTTTHVSVVTITKTMDPIPKKRLDERNDNSLSTSHGSPSTTAHLQLGEKLFNVISRSAEEENTETIGNDFFVQTTLPTVSIQTGSSQKTASLPTITTLTRTKSLSLTGPLTETTTSTPTTGYSGRFIGRFGHAGHSNHSTSFQVHDDVGRAARYATKLRVSDLSFPSFSSLVRLAKREVKFWEDHHDYHPLWYFRKKNSIKDPPPFCGMPWESLHLDYIAGGRHMRPSDCGTCFKVCSVFFRDCVYVLTVEDLAINGVNMRKKKSWDFGPFMKHWKKVDTHWCGGIWNGTMLPEWGGDAWHGGTNHTMPGPPMSTLPPGPTQRHHHHIHKHKDATKPLYPPNPHTHTPVDPRATYTGILPPGHLPNLPATFPFNTKSVYSAIETYHPLLPNLTNLRPPQ